MVSVLMSTTKNLFLRIIPQHPLRLRHALDDLATFPTVDIPSAQRLKWSLAVSAWHIFPPCCFDSSVYFSRHLKPPPSAHTSHKPHQKPQFRSWWPISHTCSLIVFSCSSPRVCIGGVLCRLCLGLGYALFDSHLSKCIQQEPAKLQRSPSP